MIILIIKQRNALISQIYFWNRTLHVSDRFSVHHQESSTEHTAIGIRHTEILKMGKITSVYTCIPWVSFPVTPKGFKVLASKTPRGIE